MAYMQSKAYKDAADSFRKALRFKPDWAEANFRFGVMSYVLGRRSQSTEAYKKLLELNSPLANTLYRIIKAESDPAGVAETVVGESDIAVANVPPPAPTAQPTVDPTPSSSEKTGNGGPDTSSVAAAATTTSDEPELTNVYKIGIGDVLDVRVLNSSVNRSSLYTVLDGGVIDLPVAGGAISVVGLTTEEVQERIATELKRRAVEDRAQVSVGVRHYASHTVVVTGLVGSAGTKVLRREVVPLYVILAEVQPRLDAARVVVMRAGSAAETLELNDSASLNFIIRPGDVINVTARPQEFYYIAGRVNFPGQKNFQPGITLLQAVLAAGGVIDNAKSVELSREGNDGLLTTSKINLKDIKSGKAQDVKIRPGDRIEVR
jgi:protein involved in polysaccharide export with SLBB domain